MTAHTATIVTRLLATAALAFAAGCVEGPCESESCEDELCIDGACEDEEVAETEQALISIDFKKGCKNKGWIWFDATQTCKSPKTVCEANGNFWHPDDSACLAWGSTAHKEAACERKRMVHVADGSPNVYVNDLHVHCEPKKVSGGLGLSGGGSDGSEYELPCEVGLNCPVNPNPNTWDPYPNSTSWAPTRQCHDPAFCL